VTGRRPTVVVLGLMTTMPVAGIVWLTIPYLVGLRRLGYDVYYVEAHARTPSMLMRAPDDDGAALAADFIDRVMRRFGFGQSWAYHALHADGRVYGLSEPALQKLYRSADLLFNLHGGTDPLPEHHATGRLVLIETDPVELEIELHRGDERARDFLVAHSAVFTWGTNFGHPDCRVPLPAGHQFHHSRMPILIDQWRLPNIQPRPVFTTVGNWQQAWRDVEFEGETYTWSKHHEFEKFLELPRRTNGQLELALASCDDATRQRLTESGWQVRAAADVSSDVDVYRRYIVSSCAEFTVAKDQNVRLQSGWFSDRSAAYLAASRPVITQETGFSNSMPVGEGLFAFSTLEEAVDAVDEVERNYKRHSRAALAIAREFFDYRVVLGTMLDQLGARPGSSIRAREPRNATCILGVDEESTSVVARLVELVGAGGQPAVATTFERELIEVNDALLHRFSGDDLELPQFPADWERSAAVADLYLRARAAVALIPDDDLIFGTADPRIALTLPFWRRVLPQLSCVVCVRDPHGAARALVDNGHAASLPAAAELWCRYTDAALHSSHEERRILVFSEDLHRRPEVELARVADFLGRSEAAADPEVARALRNALDAGGSPVSALDALEDPALSFEAKSLFLTLRLLRADGDAERRELATAVSALAALGVAEVGRELELDHPGRAADEKPRRAACTIISKNYLAHARVLAESFHAVHPDIRFFVLLVDRNDGSISPTREPFDVIELEELDAPDLLRLCFQYSVIELNTAVKPYLLAHLMEHHEIDRLMYFDPDILVVDRLSEVWDLLDKHSIVLTPHLTEPVEDDGKKPSEIDILLSGTYNLGFLGLARSEATRRLLTWWQERLYDRCVVAHDEGLFTDQRWMDLVPGLFDDAYVLREPGYNVAYWNLHSRRVSVGRDRVRVNGKPAVFFHFSGLDPHAPLEISRHQNRFRLDELGDLAQIFHRYRKLLFEAGYEALKGLSYGFATFDNGVAIPDLARSLYRRLGKDALRFGDPFATAPVGSFFRWLNAPVPDDALSARPITRLWYEIYGLRPDVRHEFPDLFGNDRTGFLHWAGSTGLDELGIDPALLPGARGESANTDRFSEANGDRRFGVNVSGYFGSEKGMGEAVRSDVRLLRTAGIPFSIDDFVDSGSVNPEAVARSFDGNPYGFNLVHVNADQLPTFAASRPPNYFEGRYTIGYWTWELSNFPPDWRPSFDYVDEVWVPSTFALDSIARGATKPVLRIPHVLEPDAPIAPTRRSDFGLPEDAFLFLFMFDFHSVVDRKNPFGLIEAFKRAFRPAERVGLVLKCSHSEYDPELLAALRYAAGGARVHFVDAILNRPQVRSLMSLADAYASLHRSEGFGLTMAEAMALGKPVVATGYSGNMDFMRPANSFLVDYELVRIKRDHGPYPKGSVWADPDLEQAAQLLRAVVDQPGIAAERGAVGRRNVLRELDPEAVGRIVSQRLIDVADLRWSSARSKPKPVAVRETALPVYDALVQRIRETVAGVVPPQSELAVVSKGDEQLLLLGDRRCWHFPCTPSGVYAGHHPADDDEAIAQLENARATGVEYLVFPATASWWLEHYARLREHLESNYAQLVEDPDSCVIYRLTAPRAPAGAEQLIDDVGYTHLVEHVRDVIRQTIPSDSEIAIISKGDEALVEVNGYRLRHFPGDGNGDYAGYYPGDSRAAIGELEATRERGVRYLVIPKPAFWWLGFYIDFAQHIRERYPLVHTSSDCVIYELAPAASANGRGKLSRLLPRRAPHR
jgi:glycosyltransferase involved in cell wall biosynthesis/lipopolysaccharide biosynthesis glycosyltransferase